MNVFKLRIFFFLFPRHDTVQSSPLSSEQIRSEQSAGEKNKGVPSLCDPELCLRIDTMDVYDRLCTKIFPIVYQI